MTGIFQILLAAIALQGVQGKDLRARAFFDANNVKVGDPLVLTVDFLGNADFKSLHPPALSRAVDRKDWKVDDASAKTDTYRDARRLTYRVRPMREGVLWFPSLEFAYDGPDGSRRTVRANEIPVHAKVGAQVVVAEMSEDVNEMPKPDPLVTDPSSVGGPVVLTDDEMFAWKKACRMGKADDFAAFDFPAAKLNEAACALRDGNWARAMKVYQRLEWRIGQTPAVEHGIVAALAVRYDNPSAELPVWRQVGRPILKYGWKGRVGIVLGGFAALVLAFWLIGRGIRAVACLMIVLCLPFGVSAQDIFRQMEEQMQRMRQRMNQMTSGFNFHFGEKERREMPTIIASVATSNERQQVGEPFEFIVSLEAPKTCSIGQIQMTPSETFGMTVTGKARNLPDGESANPSNSVKRIAVPVRYDVPFSGELFFTVAGMVTGRSNGGRRNSSFSFTFSNSFEAKTEPIRVDIRPLPSAGQPEGFAGVVSEGLRLHEILDILTVETNDIIQITYRMYPKGYVPEAFLPPGSAFEMGRECDEDRRPRMIEYRRFFVADGAEKTPEIVVPYFDPRDGKYHKAKSGGTRVRYK